MQYFTVPIPGLHFDALICLDSLSSEEQIGCVVEIKEGSASKLIKLNCTELCQLNEPIKFELESTDMSSWLHQNIRLSQEVLEDLDVLEINAC